MGKGRGGLRGTLAVAASVGLLAGHGCAPATGSSGGPHPGAGLSDVRTYLREAAEEDAFSGVVLLARGDDVVLHEAYGFAEREFGVPMRTDHRLRIGSLTKPVTASAVLAAAERGLLSLERSVCSVLPACPRAWEAVTVRHLLTHTSGVPDHFGDLDAVPVEATVEELHRVVRGLPADAALRADPGEAYRYSNFDYVLLGAVLEDAVGVPWEAALRQLVLDPVGLPSMRYDDVWAVVPGRARGYTRDEAGRIRHVEYDDHAAYAAGGLLSTAADLFRWSRAFLTGRIVPEGRVAEALTPYRDGYGYGWQIRDFLGRRAYNHTGGIDGFSSVLTHYPGEGLTVVVLSNVETDSAILTGCDLAALFFGWHGEENRAPRDLTVLEPRARCGVEG